MARCSKPEHAAVKNLGMVTLVPTHRIELLTCGCVLMWDETPACAVVHPGVKPASLDQMDVIADSGMSWREVMVLECGCMQTKTGGVLISPGVYKLLCEEK